MNKTLFAKCLHDSKRCIHRNLLLFKALLQTVVLQKVIISPWNEMSCPSCICMANKKYLWKSSGLLINFENIVLYRMWLDEFIQILCRLSSQYRITQYSSSFRQTHVLSVLTENTKFSSLLFLKIKLEYGCWYCTACILLYFKFTCALITCLEVSYVKIVLSVYELAVIKIPWKSIPS